MVQLSPYEVLYSPMSMVGPSMVSLFENFIRMGEADFSQGIQPLRNAIPVLKLVKQLGFFPQFFPHPKYGTKCCRISNSEGDLVFEATGKTQEEATIRACALAIMAHSARLSA